MSFIAPVTGVLIGGALAAPVIAAGQVQRARQHLVDEATCYRLHFSQGVEPKQVEHLLAGLTGWRTPWWRPWAAPVVVFEVAAGPAGIEHRALVPTAWATSFEQLAAAHLGDVHLEQIESRPVKVRVAASYQLSDSGRPLRIEPVAQARGLHAVLQPLEEGQQIVHQVSISPRGPVGAPGAEASKGSILSSVTPSLTGEQLSALRQKLSAPVLGVTLRIGAMAASDDVARGLLRRAEASLHLSNAPGAHLRRASVPSRQVVKRLETRHIPLGAPALVMNVAELVGPLGLPLGSSPTPGITRQGCRPLTPSAALPQEGTVLGDADAPGQQRPVAVEMQGRYRHLLITGPTGTGKTTLLTHLVVDDMNAGRSVLVLDAKGDLVDAVLERVPQHRRGDVAVLDPSDADLPVGFNPLRPVGIDPELAAEQVIAVMHQVWADSWGVRSDDILRAALRTIVTDPKGTLGDIGPLLTEPTFRARLTSGLSDPTLVGFWRSFEALSEAEQSQWTAPPLNKWRSLFARPSLRRVLAQAEPSFNLAHALDHRGIVLVPLSAGLLGSEAAGLFGSFLMGSVWGLIQARASQPAVARRPLMVHVDELARVAALPVPLDELLAQARSFNVATSLATQHLAQLPTALRQAVLANPRSRVAFQASHDDAQVLAREFGLGLTADDLQGLAAHQVVAQVYAAGRTQPACTLRTRPASPATSDAGELRRASRERWGTGGAAIDAWLSERMNGHRPADGPRKTPGRKPRGSR